jgi:hypothetical protein
VTKCRDKRIGESLLGKAALDAPIGVMRRTTMWPIEAGRPCFIRAAHLLAKALGVHVVDLMSQPPEGKLNVCSIRTL